MGDVFHFVAFTPLTKGMSGDIAFTQGCIPSIHLLVLTLTAYLKPGNSICFLT